MEGGEHFSNLNQQATRSAFFTPAFLKVHTSHAK